MPAFRPLPTDRGPTLNHPVDNTFRPTARRRCSISASRGARVCARPPAFCPRRHNRLRPTPCARVLYRSRQKSGTGGRVTKDPVSEFRIIAIDGRDWMIRTLSNGNNRRCSHTDTDLSDRYIKRMVHDFKLAIYTTDFMVFNFRSFLLSPLLS